LLEAEELLEAESDTRVFRSFTSGYLSALDAIAEEAGLKSETRKVYHT
jgi:hypothetical protein